MTAVPSQPDLRLSLRDPASSLRAFDAGEASLRRGVPRAWVWLTLIAVVGSCIYGASLSFAVPQWSPGRGALLLAVSAGVAWCLFGPVVALVGRVRLLTCAHACLVTMAYGEGVLLLGAALNLLLSQAGAAVTAFLSPLNIGVVLLANAVMAAIFVTQMRALGVPIWKTLLLWMLFLNGACAALFLMLSRVLEAGR